MKFFLAIVICLISISSYSQPKVGRQAAAKYLGKSPAQEADIEQPLGSNYLMLHFGVFTQSDAYVWGSSGKQTGVGKNSLGLSYLISEGSTLDQWLRVEYNTYEINDEKPQKLSALYAMTFPLSSSEFPIYFGGAAGVGVYFKQIKEESNISFDYLLFAGLRWNRAIESVGFFIEAGLRNHLHILSDGQLNATYFQGGVLFNF